MYTNHKGAYSSHTHVRKTVPYIGAATLSWENFMYINHKGAYSSHTHVHKTVPYIGALHHGQVLCTPMTKGHTLVPPTYI